MHSTLRNKDKHQNSKSKDQVSQKRTSIAIRLEKQRNSEDYTISRTNRNGLGVSICIKKKKDVATCPEKVSNIRNLFKRSNCPYSFNIIYKS